MSMMMAAMISFKPNPPEVLHLLGGELLAGMANLRK